MFKTKLLSASVIALLLGSSVLAQSNGDEPQACAGCGLCGGSMVVVILIPIIWFALNIAFLVWIARDAKSRGMDSAVIWMILVMCTGLIGFLIYIFSRPQGNTVRCQRCGNNRLQASARCPHCGNA